MSSLQGHSSASSLSRYLPLVIWIVFISFASSDEFSAANTSRIIGPFILWLLPKTTTDTLELVHFLTRKAGHFTEYAILAYLAARAFRTSPRVGLRRRWVLVSLILITTYAFVDEYHQSFVPSRTASIFDSMIDITGGLTVLIFLRIRKGA
jgi:VanZ family protein